MTAGTVPPKSMDPKCDTSALDRNLAMSRKYKVTGTPALVFENGTRVPGAIGATRSRSSWPAPEVLTAPARAAGPRKSLTPRWRRCHTTAKEGRCRHNDGP
jgi:hypothetical protein